jgi:hypothetical protein
MRNAIFAGLVASSFAVGVDAQQAVQWKVSDGGNGHWYAYIGAEQTWQASKTAAEAMGGHLVSIGSEAEAVLIRSLGSDTCWIGLFQDRSASDYFEPAGGWRWVTAEPLSFTNWRVNTNGQPNEPNDLGGGEDWAHLDAFATTWNDLPGGSYPFAVEWSADCNGDGIVDYGQCRDGTLPDYNGNSIPDCCEAGAPCSVGKYPVQWRVEDGGNGHWYQVYFSSPMGLNWADAESHAVGHGGHLASITSAAENDHILRIVKPSGPDLKTFWVGGYRSDAACSPPCFEWTSGEPWSFTSWGPGGPPFDSWGCWDPQPNYCGWGGPGSGVAVEFLVWSDGTQGLWNDEMPNLIGTGASGAPHVVEWSADCNSDGLVDKGQILRGQLADLNTDGVPDICQQPTCLDADIFRDFNVNGGDLGILLSQWGPKTPLTRSDLNRDGAVDGADLGIFLSFWGPCP